MLVNGLIPSDFSPVKTNMFEVITFFPLSHSNYLCLYYTIALLKVLEFSSVNVY